MSETATYIVITKEASYTKAPRSDTRVEGVIGVAWDDGVLRMDGAKGPLLVAPMSEIVYIKRVESNGSSGDIKASAIWCPCKSRPDGQIFTTTNGPAL